MLIFTCCAEADTIKKRGVKRLPIWIVFAGIIGGLLGFGALVDYIAKKRSIELDPEEGI